MLIQNQTSAQQEAAFEKDTLGLQSTQRAR